MSDEQDDDNSRNNKKVFKFGYYAHQLKKALTDPIHWTETAKTFGITLIAILIVLLGILIVYGIYLLTVDLVLETSGEQDNESFANIRNSLFILAALIGIPFFLWRTWIAQQQSNIADKQAETARDRAYTELFTKAIEQLGAEKPKKEDVLDENGKPAKDNAGQTMMKEIYVPNIEVRIGAIYALERIMKDSEKDAASVVDTLAAYVRENCGEKTKVNRIDIKTALTVLSNRKEKYEGRVQLKLNLRNTFFKNWDLKYFNFEWCDLGNANFVNANLQRTKFDNCDLQNSTMDCAKLSGASMKSAFLSNASLKSVNFSSCNLEDTLFDDAQMQNCNLRLAKLDRANFMHASLTDSQMECARMNRCYLSDADLTRVNLSGAEMQGADMSHANMQGANMRGAEMQGADMSRAKIEKVQITSARKTAASVIWVDFTKSKFEFHELQEQLPEMFGHKEETTLPKGMAIPEHWSEADMRTNEGRAQYAREWEAFKKKMGVE